VHYPYLSYVDFKSEYFELIPNDSTDLIWNSKCSLKCKMDNQEMVIPSNSIILRDKGIRLAVNLITWQKLKAYVSI
jgi:hypothetical protein